MKSQGQHLRILMAEADIRTASDLADRLKVSRPAVSGWLNDKASMSACYIVALADELKLNDKELAALIRAAGSVHD